MKDIFYDSGLYGYHEQKKFWKVNDILS